MGKEIYQNQLLQPWAWDICCTWQTSPSSFLNLQKQIHSQFGFKPTLLSVSPVEASLSRAVDSCDLPVEELEKHAISPRGTALFGETTTILSAENVVLVHPYPLTQQIEQTSVKRWDKRFWRNPILWQIPWYSTNTETASNLTNVSQVVD